MHRLPISERSFHFFQGVPQWHTASTCPAAWPSSPAPPAAWARSLPARWPAPEPGGGRAAPPGGGAGGGVARAGAGVVLASRRVERLKELRAHIEGEGGDAHVIALDVTDHDSIKS